MPGYSALGSGSLIIQPLGKSKYGSTFNGHAKSTGVVNYWLYWESVVGAISDFLAMIYAIIKGNPSNYVFVHCTRILIKTV